MAAALRTAMTHHSLQALASIWSCDIMSPNFWPSLGMLQYQNTMDTLLACVGPIQT